MDFGISTNSSFHHSAISNYIALDNMNSSSLVSNNGTYQRFYETSEKVNLMFFILYVIVFFFAFLENSLVMWIVMTTRRKTNVTSTLIANMALADIITAILVMTFQVSWSAPTNILQVISSLRL